MKKLVKCSWSADLVLPQEEAGGGRGAEDEAGDEAGGRREGQTAGDELEPGWEGLEGPQHSGQQEQGEDESQGGLDSLIPGLTAERDDDPPDHPTEGEEEEEAAHSQRDEGREGVEEPQEEEGGEDLEADDDQLHGHLGCQVVAGVHPQAPVPGQGAALQLRHQQVRSQGERHEEESGGNHPGQHRQVTLGLQAPQGCWYW